jgi:hypothetical protein
VPDAAEVARRTPALWLTPANGTTVGGARHLQLPLRPAAGSCRARTGIDVLQLSRGVVFSSSARCFVTGPVSLTCIQPSQGGSRPGRRLRPYNCPGCLGANGFAGEVGLVPTLAMPCRLGSRADADLDTLRFSLPRDRSTSGGRTLPIDFSDRWHPSARFVSTARGPEQRRARTRGGGGTR